eukprot:6197973-Pleurochrysis_carterae.AAC.4
MCLAPCLHHPAFLAYLHRLTYHSRTRRARTVSLSFSAHVSHHSFGHASQVIYGDTDSVMVHSATDDLAAARKMADALKREVNKHYRRAPPPPRGRCRSA